MGLYLCLILGLDDGLDLDLSLGLGLDSYLQLSLGFGVEIGFVVGYCWLGLNFEGLSLNVRFMVFV